jgi:peptidyl-prolyl cis-trans isomerase A (cyclophilin A)
VFGRVVSGMEIVDKIESTPTTLRAGRRDVPVETVTIESVAVIAAQ